MVKEKYSSSKKAIALVFQYVSAIVFIMMLMICLRFMDQANNIGKNVPFEDSGKFAQKFDTQSSNIVSYLTRVNLFEKGIPYDGEHLFDVGEYLNGKVRVGSYQSRYLVSMEDMLRWSQAKGLPEEGTIYFVMGTQEESGLGRGDFLEGKEGPLTDELMVQSVENEQGKLSYIYLSKATISFIDGGMSWPYDELQSYGLNLNYEDVMGQLNSVVTGSLLEKYAIYKEEKFSYKPDYTNLRFLLQNPYGEVLYANSEYQEINQLKKLGKYVVISGVNSTIDSNIPIPKERLYQFMRSMVEQLGEDETIAISIDTSYPVEDSFSSMKEEYDLWQPWIFTCTVMAVVALIILLLSLSYLSLAAGHTKNEEEIKLQVIDRIYTEFFVAVGIFGFLMTAGILSSMTVEVVNPLVSLLILSGILFFANTVFIVCYLSIIRRIKAGTLWKDSLSRRLYDALKIGLENGSTVVKVSLSYGVFILLNMILLAGIGGGGGIFLACILDISFGIRVLRESAGKKRMLQGILKISDGDLNYKIDPHGLSKDNRTIALAINNIGWGLQKAVDEKVKAERLKADLITNVSHDIKTPLTSIINYVALLKREDIKNEKIKGYLDILENKSQRLKNLTEDLVEASKVSTGNIVLEMINMNFNELILQTNGEFSEKFAARNLEIIMNLTKEPVSIVADGRRMWRVIENVYNNVAKYAMPNTRVYVDEYVEHGKMYFSVKNISERALNIHADELTERFIRGDVSRSTEGSGLGLSIAKDLTKLQGGQFEIYLDGDLFKVTIVFPIIYQYVDPNVEYGNMTNDYDGSVPPSGFNQDIGSSQNNFDNQKR